MDSITAFVDCLANAKTGQHVHNPYTGESPAAAVCRTNLAQYLRMMAQQQPDVLLIGEAPGYRGCSRTGIPFTSEAILTNYGRLGQAKGFSCPAGPGAPQREATATIVWRTLDDLALRPLMWNIFPFHPHRPGHPASNRTPTSMEILSGQPFVRALLDTFPIAYVVAVGNKAAHALEQWSIGATAVRHPAHGGGAQFRRQLQEWQVGVSGV